MHKIKKRQKAFKIVLIILLLSITVLIAYLIFFSSKNSVNNKEFEVKDRCGRFANLISHTIQNDRSCKIQCQNQCEAVDKKLYKHEFTKINTGCNRCFCTCKKEWWK